MEHDYEEGEGGKPEEEESNLRRLDKQQEEARGKQRERSQRIGQLLRSKGFMWIATSHHIVGGWQQAGNVFHLKALTPWMGEVRQIWENTPSEEFVLPYILQPSGEEWRFADRRQELVFIGQQLKHETIQKILDLCLLDDLEMRLGPEKWEESMADVDKIQLTYLNVSIKEID